MIFAEVISAVHPRLNRIARGRLPSYLREDATQEAMIAVWREEERIMSADSPEAMATAVGASVIRHYDPSRAATGAPERSIGSGRTEQASHAMISSEWLSELGIDFADAEADIDTRLDVDRAVSTLSDLDRRIVLGRFWLGLGWRELGERLGYSTSGIFNQWDRHTRPALALALAKE